MKKDKPDFVLLFNSSIHPTYRENIFRLVGLPSGSQLRFRYSVGVNTPTVDLFESLKGKEALIVFVDRDVADYRYIPVRRAVVISAEVEESRVYVDCQLSAYAAIDSDEATRVIRSANSSAPKMVGSDRTCARDGYYLMEVKKRQIDKLLTDAENSWARVVEQLIATQRIADDDHFLKVRIVDSRGKEMVPRVVGKHWRYSLRSHTGYSLVCSYFNGSKGAKGRELRIALDDSIKTYVSTVHRMGSVSDRFDIPIFVETRFVRTFSLIHLAAGVEGGEQFRLDLPVKISSTWEVIGIVLYASIAVSGTFLTHGLGSESFLLFLIGEGAKYLSALRLLIRYGRSPL